MATTQEGLETTTGPDRRFGPAQIALAVVGVLLVLFLVWSLFLRSDDETAETSAPAAPAPAVTPEEEEAEQAPPPGRSPVETFEVFAPKDPFDPLVSAASASGGSATTGTSDGTTTATTDGTSTTTTTDGTGTTTTTTTGNGGNGGQDVGGHRVRVIDVFQDGGDRRAQVQVDGTVYTVDEGERFAESFELLSTSGRCATMLYGDDQFTLCEGEEILK